MTVPLEYFAYGSNLHPARLRMRAPSCAFVCVAQLPGYRLAFHKRSLVDGSGKCNIVDSPGDVVIGAVYALNAIDFVQLDTEEVGHGGYTRIEVEVHAADGAQRRVGVYRAPRDLVDDSLAPFDWYHALVLGGARHHRLPADYLRAIEAVSCVVDADTERRRPYDALLQR